MKHLKKIFLLQLIFVSCQNQSLHSNKKQPIPDSFQHKNSVSGVPVRDSIATRNPTHLRGMFLARGNFILFLRPDSARFESYSQDASSGINETDADFGVGISATEDSMRKSSKYKNIRLFVSEARYININDCKTCPVTIDRDSVTYGVILSGKGMQISNGYGFVHSGDYLSKINDYFGIK